MAAGNLVQPAHEVPWPQPYATFPVVERLETGFQVRAGVMLVPERGKAVPFAWIFEDVVGGVQ